METEFGERLRGEQLAAPELIDLEVGSVLRRQNRAAGQIGDRRAEMALNDLAAIPVQRGPLWHRHLLGRCW